MKTGMQLVGKQMLTFEESVIICKNENSGEWATYLRLNEDADINGRYFLSHVEAMRDYLKRIEERA